ncbi:distal membrane-arm assembly complex protein 2-like [Anabrus simplex]|uniref:distal membrane-arm assembly complex protein 2-like n=1 Tax=Anabrus simplex TaxID=316456 RepID=UPI0035A28B86
MCLGENKKIHVPLFLKEISKYDLFQNANKFWGNDLAAAHFIVYRNGSVKFCGRTDWVKKNEEEEYDLPEKYVPDLYVEAIDASNMPIYYEGLRNLYGLKHLKWLSFNSCPYFDDWCMDRISGEYMETLEYLDISNCLNVTEVGLCALYRFQTLQTLKLEQGKHAQTDRVNQETQENSATSEDERTRKGTEYQKAESMETAQSDMRTAGYFYCSHVQ